MHKFKLLLVFSALLNANLLHAACKSDVTLNIKSTGYSGPINIELRSGLRPGSKVVQRGTVMTTGTMKASNICPAKYFFAFSTPDTDLVNITRHFDVVEDKRGYNNPVITVTYERRSDPEGQTVAKTKRDDL